MTATADRTVVARLVLDIAGYSPNAAAASKSTAALATAQKEAATAARDAGLAQREAAAAAKDASATASASAQAAKAAQTEAASAAKAASAAQVEAAKATTDAERTEAEAVAATAKERSVAAEEALAAARAQAEADAQAASAAKTSAAEAAKYATVQRDVAAAAKEAAAVEATAARESAAAAAERTKAYKDGSTAMGMVALATGAAVGLMVKQAGDFQSATQHFVTDAGESQQNLGMVQAGILKVATDTGTSATALTDAMYHIESAGFHGADGLKELTTAAQGAKVGGADLGIVAKTLTGTMNSYNMSGDQSVTMMNQLIATVGAGDMKMNDLAGSLGNVTPKAAAAGISFAEVGGAIATMTSQNMSADQATQDLSNTISALQKPNNIAIQQMQQLGLDSNDVSQNLGQRGLTGTLQLLTTAVANHTQNGQVFIDTLKSSQNAASDANTMLQQLPPSVQNISKELLNGSITAAEYKKGISGLDAGGQHMAMQFEQLVKSSSGFNDLLKSGKPDAETFSAALSNLLGGTTGLNTALMLTGGRMATFQANVAKVQAAAKKGGSEVDNWSKIQQTFNQKIDVAKASLGALGIAIGTTLLPVVAELAKWVTSIVTPIAEWVDKNQTLTAVVLGSATALAALVVAINLAIKGAKLVTTAIDGVKAAVDYFSKSSKAAAAETEALGAAQSAAAKETEALSAAATVGAVKAEAMGAASSAAAAETDAAAISTGGWVRGLGGAIPILGAVALGASALGGELNKLVDSSHNSMASTDQWTTALLSGNTAAGNFGISAADAQKQIDSMGGKANAAIGPTAAIGVALARAGQMMGKGSEVVKNFDGALAALATSGHADQAASLMAQITSATDKQGKALVDTQADFPQYWAAVNKNAANQALNAGATANSTAALGANTAAMGANAAAALSGADATDGAAASSADATKATSAQADAQAQAATAAYALAGAQRAFTDEQIAVTDATGADTSTTKDHTAAKVNNTTATNDSTAATKAHESAAKADATTQKDLTKASTDQGKADAAAAKAASDAATAAKVNANANSTAAEKKRANASAASAAAAASRAQATADAEAGRAANAASTAADKHTAANDKSAKAASAAADASAKQAGATSDAAKQAADEAEASREATEVHKLGTDWLRAVAKAEADASDSASELDGSVKGEVDAMKSAQTQASALKDALDALNGVHISAGRAALDEQQKVADLSKALYENGKNLDITTEAGRKNMTAIYDLATAANAHAQSVADETGSIKAGSDAMDASRKEFDAVLKAAGLTTDQIDAFNKSLLNTPKIATVTLGVQADTSSAAASLQALEDKYSSTGLIFGGHHIGLTMATGGLITGPGGPTSDSVPVNASAGEYIVKASVVSQPGMKSALDTLNFGHSTASVVRPMLPSHSAGGIGGYSAAGGVGTVQVELVASGGEDMFMRFMRHAIRLRGGNVQAVLGS